MMVISMKYYCFHLIRAVLGRREINKLLARNYEPLKNFLDQVLVKPKAFIKVWSVCFLVCIKVNIVWTLDKDTV